MGQVLKRQQSVEQNDAPTEKTVTSEQNEDLMQDQTKTEHTASLMDLNDEGEDDTSSSATSDTVSEKTGVADEVTEHESDDELERMYGFAKTSEGKLREYAAEETNILKRKHASIGELEEARYGHDPSWLKNIKLTEDTELIQLGQITSHVDNVLVIKANNDFTTGKRVWEEQEERKRSKLAENELIPPPPVAPIVITPGQEAMNNLVRARLKQKQKLRMKDWKQNTDLVNEENEWAKLMLLRIGEGTIVFNEHRQPVGKICDIFGPIYEPYYTIRFPDREIMKNALLRQVPYSDEATPATLTTDITIDGQSEDKPPTSSTTEESENIEFNFVNKPVYYVIQHSSVLNVTEVIDATIQGSDALNEKNQEPNEDEVEFSDDEEERRAKKRKVEEKPSSKKPARENNARGRGRGNRSRGNRGMYRGGRGGFSRNMNQEFDPFERTSVPDYEDFAAKFNAQLAQPTTQQEHIDAESYIPRSPDLHHSE